MDRLPAEIAELERVDLSSTEVTGLSPLVGAVALRDLNVALMPVTNVTPLAGLVGLERPSLYYSGIADIAPGPG